jgi:peptidoglycan-associated lipoprotein
MEKVGKVKNNPSWVIEIQGHADVLEKDSLYSIALGEHRAQSTKMYLVSQGVSAKRIHAISYGKEIPLCFDLSKKCRQKNNRAHFRVVNE